jgi:hypothetical protein
MNELDNAELIKMNELYELLLIDKMREQRNKLLKESNFRVLID